MEEKKSKKKRKHNNVIVEADGLKFDSKKEYEYYLFLLEKKKKGEVVDIKTQPVFLLQESFKKNGITHRKISYKADFLVTYSDGRIEVVDVKGMVTPYFSMKRKMFEYKYRDHELLLLTYVKSYGGWITLEQHAKFKAEKKKLREAKKKETK